MKLPAGQNSFSFGFYQTKYQKTSLLIIWVFLQCFFLWKNGIVTSLEAVKYIDQAKLFLSAGKYSSGNFLFYSVQILLIAFCLKFNISYLWLVIFQIVMNGISMACFYSLVSQLSKNRILPFIATVYLLGFFYYQEFNTFLFTESLFCSFSIIYTYFLFSREKITIRNFIVIMLFLSLLYLTRPTGIFFIPATFVFITIKFHSKFAFKVIAASIGLAFIFFYFLFNFSLSSGGEFDFLLPYLKEEIICGVQTISHAHNLNIPVEKNSLAGLGYLIINHFHLFFRLAIQRLIAFFGVYRPYYSTFHNIIASSYFWLMYLVIIGGLKYLVKINKAEVWYFICNIGLLAIAVMLSCDEWGNRFILSVLPFILLLSVISVSNFMSLRKESGNKV
jgi:hypothetical protein